MGFSAWHDLDKRQWIAIRCPCSSTSADFLAAGFVSDIVDIAISFGHHAGNVSCRI